jgi:hypothetical protein
LALRTELVGLLLDVTVARLKEASNGRIWTCDCVFMLKTSARSPFDCVAPRCGIVDWNQPVGKQLTVQSEPAQT